MYKAFQTVIIRTPSLPFKFMHEYLANMDLKSVLSNILILESIYIASPALYTELKKVIENKTWTTNKKIQSSLTKYICRMCTRCTPFGLFAGCSVGKIGKNSITVFSGEISRKTRLDMMLLFGIYQSLTKDELVKRNSLYKLNTSIYPLGKTYRYIEYIYDHNSRFHHISSVMQTPYLNRIVKKVQKGCYIKDLFRCVMKNEVSEEEALNYIYELIDAQLLVNSLEPNIVGNNPLQTFIDKLYQMPVESTRFDYLKVINSKLSFIDGLNLYENKFEFYQEIINNLISNKISFENKYLFQVDFNKKVLKSEVSKRVIGELKSTIFFLNKITPYLSNPTLTTFRDILYNQYGNMEVPLLALLDPESGIGYPINDELSFSSPLLKDFILPHESEVLNFKLNRNQLTLLEKIIDAIKHGQKELILHDGDFDDMYDNNRNLPATLYTIFELICDTSDNILLKLNGVGGSAANLISRFSHVEPQIEKLVKDITSFEQCNEDEVIFVELVHQPDDRVGNVLFRPHLRDYELVYLANSDLSTDRIIYASDIMISVQNSKIVLRSKTLNKIIIPRITNAHNYFISNIPLYRFLGELQNYHQKDLYENFHFLDYLLKYKPRIKYGNTILFPESWVISIDTLKEFIIEEDDYKMLNSIDSWRKEKGMPEYVLLSDADNELLIDFKSILSLRAFFSVIKKRNKIRIHEFIFDEDKGTVFDKRNNVYRNECIVSFYKEREAYE